MIHLFNNLKLDYRNILLVTNDMYENVLLSARNLQYVDVMRVSDLATYNIMRAKSLVFVESSVQGLNEMFNLNEE